MTAESAHLHQAVKPSGSGHELRMLIVEDDPEIARSLQRLLIRKFSAQVELASDIFAARETIHSMDFDLILLDYQLPDGNGLELLEEISETRDHAPVIMVTGQGDEAIASQAFRLHASGYVVKDSKLSALLPEVVGGALGEMALRKAEARVRRSEETERALLNATSESLLLLDPDGTILVANETAAGRLGMTGAKAVGKNFYDSLPAGRRVDVKRSVDGVFRSGTPQSFEYVADGRYFAGAVYPADREHGDVQRVAVFSQDVTETKVAEGELRKARDELEDRVSERTAQLMAANEELRAEIAVRQKIEDSLKTLSAQVHGQARMLDDVLSSSPDYFFLMDRRGKFIYANSTAAQVLGLKQSEMEGKYWWDLGLPENAMRPLDIQREAVLSNGENRSGRLELPTPSGEREFEYFLSPVKEWNGSTRTVVATLRSVSTGDATMAELERKVARLEERAGLLDLLPVALFVRDMNGRVTLWTGGAERVYGWSADEALGQPATELLQTRYPQPVREIDSYLLEHGRWEGTLIRTAVDGEEVAVSSAWVLELDATREPRAILELDQPVRV
jgi:PAS domain S-box-containing protein